MGLVAQQVFLKLSLHAKMQSRLDDIAALDLRRRQDVLRIEEEEIRSFEDDARFSQLEAMKRELLAIRFIHKDDIA